MPLRRAEAAAANFTSILIVPHALGLLATADEGKLASAARFEDSFRRCEAFHDAEARWLWARVATSCLIAMSAFCARREKEEEES